MPPHSYNVVTPSPLAVVTRYKNSKHSSMTDAPGLHFKKANMIKITHSINFFVLCFKKALELYSFDIISTIKGIFATISSEEAISGTRQNAARTVTDSCKYASRLLSTLLLLLPVPNPSKNKYTKKKNLILIIILI